ncbi:MAG: hypothetical protein NVS2B4_17990 [Ramlibacter sp.]
MTACPPSRRKQSSATSGALRDTLVWLLRRRGPLWRQCVVYGSIALVPALLAGALLERLLVALGIDPKAFVRQDLGTGLGEFLAAVFLAPVLETAVLALGLGALSFASRRLAFITLSSGAIWGVIHARLGLLALVPTGWAFFVFSCAYLAWRRDSFRSAYAAAALSHGLYNAVLMGLAVLLPGL